MTGFVTLFFLITSCAAIDWDETTPLDEYVFSDDEIFSYEERPGGYEGEGYYMHRFFMTSQQWMDESVSEDSIWHHHVTLAIPNEFTYTDAGMVVIGAGNKNDGPPSDVTMTRIGMFANQVGVPVVYIRNVPHTPITFIGDDSAIAGDSIIARTWKLYVEETIDDPNINLLFPMTKAGKRAIDLMVAEVQSRTGNEITKVMTQGGSKRGWAAWLLACVDQRVFATAPVSYDPLNWHDSYHHHNQALGGWSYALRPYWAEDFTKYIDHPRTAHLMDEHAVDPFSYNERLVDTAKLIVMGTGDQYFPLWDSHFYFPDLLGDKNFMQVLENTGHSMGSNSNRVWQNFGVFFRASYETETGGQITVTLDRAPKEITGWTADTTDFTVETDDDGNDIHRRDFRMNTIDGENSIEWTEIPVEDLGDNKFSLEMDLREDDVGYRGFFIKMTFAGPGILPPFNDLDFTTEVHIIPDSFPFEQCEDEECTGILK